ncbi:MAG: hypothetical protein QOH25_2184 [Acidobacteriota bacterium]|jgi:hypothetical protein|nr:hypothetical protein [Acidobacteriota bacterium]
MFSKKMFSVFAAFVLLIAASLGVTAMSAAAPDKGADKARVEAPLNLAILVQDDLVSRVGNELKVTGEFIRSLPAGSRVMVAYIRAGSLQVRQPFTDDLEKAAKSLRQPAGNTAVAPYNPYVEVIEALRRFEDGGANRNALLLISDGLDTSRGFDVSSAGNTIDLLRAVKEAQKRNVAIYSFYAPTAGLTSWNHTAIGYGQSSLNRLSNETGGRAFFQGTSFVTFNSYFDRLRQTLNDQYAKAY